MFRKRKAIQALEELETAVHADSVAENSSPSGPSDVDFSSDAVILEWTSAATSAKQLDLGPDPIRDLRYRINELRYRINMAWSMLEKMVQWNRDLQGLEDELNEWYERAREKYAWEHPL